MQAHNLSNNDYLEFDPGTTPEYAVAYGYFASNNMTSQFFAMNQDGDTSWKSKLIYGEKSVSMGDWAAII